MSFFGLFKKGPKNSLEEIKQIWTDIQIIVDKLSQEKICDQSSMKNNPDLQKKIERICNSLYLLKLWF